MAVSIDLGAEVLPDPTRPPLNQSVEMSASPASGAVSGDALVLQSVLRGGGRAPAAIISGQSVKLGESVVDMHLERVNESSVLLKGPQGETTLQLIPGVQKKIHVAPASEGASRRARSAARKHSAKTAKAAKESQAKERP